jgi:arginine repressor
VNVLNTRAARRDLIVQIIRSQAVASQTDLVELLRERGIDVTQATVSRDLDELGAVKTQSADGRILYAVPAEGGEDRLQADELEDINARLIRPADSARSGAVPGQRFRPQSSDRRHRIDRRRRHDHAGGR